MVRKRRMWMIKMRAFSQRITWFLGTRFPETIPLVFVVGHPKSGTTWASQLVADYMQLPFPRHFILPIGFPAVVHGHMGVWDTYPRAVYVVRDPRDVMVSWYFHGLRLGTLWHRRREQDRSDDGMAGRDSVVADLPEYIEDHMRRGSRFRQKMNWAEHVQTYLDRRHDRVALLRYEELLRNGAEHLAQAVRVLTGEPADMERVHGAINRFSFQKQAKRRQGTEDRSSFLRKGAAGDWQGYFSREAAEVLDHYCGEVMLRMGYATNRAWIKSCPRLAEFTSQCRLDEARP
jgi:hypothetical protein